MKSRAPSVEKLFVLLKNRRFAPGDLPILQGQLEKRFLTSRPHFDARGAFKQLTSDDLHHAFVLIDNHYLDGLCQQACRAEDHHLSFRLGARMTRCGGRTTTRNLPGRGKRKSFEIAIAPRLIDETFRHREAAEVTGVRCESPLQALLRIMEHEMLHMLEMMLWSSSSCAQRRFKTIAARLFGHRASHHQLLTPQEIAVSVHQIGIGTKVLFRRRAEILSGVVNHINRRATVLVPDQNGVRFSDGKRYSKFYVPLESLKKIG